MDDGDSVATIVTGDAAVDTTAAQCSAVEVNAITTANDENLTVEILPVDEALSLVPFTAVNNGDNSSLRDSSFFKSNHINEEKDTSTNDKNANLKNHQGVQRNENISLGFNDESYFDKGDTRQHTYGYSNGDCCQIQNIDTKCAEGKFSTNFFLKK